MEWIYSSTSFIYLENLYSGLRIELYTLFLFGLWISSLFERMTNIFFLDELVATLKVQQAKMIQRKTFWLRYSQVSLWFLSLSKKLSSKRYQDLFSVIICLLLFVIYAQLSHKYLWLAKLHQIGHVNSANRLNMYVFSDFSNDIEKGRSSLLKIELMTS